MEGMEDMKDMESPGNRKRSEVGGAEEQAASTRAQRLSTAAARAAARVEAFCAQTSIHGLKYVGERRRPWPERLLWTAAFALSLAACAVLISRAWRRWRESPVIVALDERLRPVWEVPFPAITVCPETRIRSAFFNYTDAHLRWRRGELSAAELRGLSYVSLLCDPHLFQTGFKYIPSSAMHILHEASPRFNDTLYIVKWRGAYEKGPALFQPLMTEEGLCYSFNMLHHSGLFREDSFQGTGRYLAYGPEATAGAEPGAEPGGAAGWSPDGGYDAGAGVDAYPRRALGAGALLGLSVVLRLRTADIDFLCKGPAQGFKIQLHSPAEFPRMAQQFFRAQLNHDLVVAVSPQVMATSDELRSYRPHQRQCYFAGERRLRFFRVYTQQNCALECLANATLRACGCSAYYMPREANGTVCGTASWKCVRDARDELLRSDVERGLHAQGGGGDGAPSCDCLQSCSALAYASERSQSDYDWAKMLGLMGEDPALYEGFQLVRVHIFFRDGFFIGSRRSEMYGNTDFLANCGGLLGLGLGISVLSLVELLFWLLPRVFCCRLRMRTTQQCPAGPDAASAVCAQDYESHL